MKCIAWIDNTAHWPIRFRPNTALFRFGAIRQVKSGCIIPARVEESLWERDIVTWAMAEAMRSTGRDPKEAMPPVVEGQIWPSAGDPEQAV